MLVCLFIMFIYYQISPTEIKSPAITFIFQVEDAFTKFDTSGDDRLVISYRKSHERMNNEQLICLSSVSVLEIEQAACVILFLFIEDLAGLFIFHFHDYCDAQDHSRERSKENIENITSFCDDNNKERCVSIVHSSPSVRG